MTTSDNPRNLREREAKLLDELESRKSASERQADMLHGATALSDEDGIGLDRQAAMIRRGARVRHLGDDD